MVAGTHERKRSGRAGLLILGVVALAAGIAGGLARLGAPWEAPTAAALHGALMVSGFLGTVISLERAIALGHPLAYVAPLAAGLGAAAMLAGWHDAGRLLWVAAPLALLGTSLAIVRRQPQLHTILLAVAALFWLLGQGLAFLVLTIAAERLEMTRLVRRPRWASGLFIALVALMPLRFEWAIAGLAAWLLVFDVARHTVKRPGLPRFAAIALMAGYAWLLVGAFAGGGLAIHAVTLGFVFSMIFAHAPIIVPVVLRTQVRFSAWLYVPLVLLHLSMLVRAFAPGLLAGALNAAAIAVFIVTFALSARARAAP